VRVSALRLQRQYAAWTCSAPFRAPAPNIIRLQEVGSACNLFATVSAVSEQAFSHMTSYQLGGGGSRLQQNLQGRRHQHDAADPLRHAQARHVLCVLLAARDSQQQRTSASQRAEQLLHRRLCPPAELVSAPTPQVHHGKFNHLAHRRARTSKEMGVRCRKTSSGQNSSLLRASRCALSKTPCRLLHRNHADLAAAVQVVSQERTLPATPGC